MLTFKMDFRYSHDQCESTIKLKNVYKMEKATNSNSFW